ncbi:MAG: permease-like cell division protein FtsX [Deltaproteobacteria bacterium]
MKLRTFRYLVKEGFANTLRNKLMFLASTITVTASLIILGIFILIGANVSLIGKNIESGLMVQVFLDTEIKADKIDDIGKRIKSFNIGKVSFISKEQAFKKLKSMDMMKGHERLLEGYNETNNFLPPSFMITLSRAEDAQMAVSQLKTLPDVKAEDVVYHKEVIDKVIKMMNVIRIVSLIVLALLAATAILIISNTVKLTVFARRKEIGIMKYIGATDFFIHLPFVIESVLIGGFSCLLAFILIFQGYEAVIGYLKIKSIVNDIGINNFVSFTSISQKLMIVYLFIGVGMGCVGSSISMRKYLKV